LSWSANITNKYRAAKEAKKTKAAKKGKGKGKGKKGKAGDVVIATATQDQAAVETAAPAGADAAVGAGVGAVSDAVTGTFLGFVASSIAGLDFGICTPTIKFEESLNNRKPGEFTFQAIDPVVNKGQGEALNPNIITNRICDVVSTTCGANDAAIAACDAAQAQILALGTKDQTTADEWNTILGFEGTDTNPDNAPQAGLIGHT
jgi:hypothetical protein